MIGRSCTAALWTATGFVQKRLDVAAPVLHPGTVGGPLRLQVPPSLLALTATACLGVLAPRDFGGQEGEPGTETDVNETDVVETDVVETDVVETGSMDTGIPADTDVTGDTDLPTDTGVVVETGGADTAGADTADDTDGVDTDGVDTEPADSPTATP